MNKQFKKQFNRIFKNKLLKSIIICSIPVLLLSFNPSNLQDNHILKMDKGQFQGVTKSFIAIGQRIVSDFPCGEAIGIALQDAARYIFSSASAFNATLVPGTNHEIHFPDDSNNKMLKENPMSYPASFNRINNLKIGVIDGYYGERWAIDAKQLWQEYPGGTFDVQVEGKTETAFDHSNMFYEMLISIQHLSKENEQLKDRLASIEERLNMPEDPRTISSADKTNQVEIMPNPVSKGQITIEYQLNDEIKNAQLNITDLNGRVLKVFNLDGAGTLQIEEINLAAGVYLYQLIYDGQKTASQKLIVQ